MPPDWVVGIKSNWSKVRKCSIRPAEDDGLYAWVWVVAYGWALYLLLFYDLFNNEILGSFADVVTADS